MNRLKTGIVLTYVTIKILNLGVSIWLRQKNKLFSSANLVIPQLPFESLMSASVTPSEVTNVKHCNSNIWPMKNTSILPVDGLQTTEYFFMRV